MTEVFLHDPFGEPYILAAILGPEVPPAWRVALSGHAVLPDADGLRPALVRRPGGAAAGAVLATTATDLARLDFAMAALGARRVTLDDGRQGYRFAAEPAAGPAPGGRQRLREAIEEVMGHFGHRAPDEMPALMHGIAIRALARSRGDAGAGPAGIGTGMGGAQVEAVERRFGYARHFAVEEHVLRHRRFDGRMSPPLERSVFTSGDAVTLLPFDPRRSAVLLIEQFRAAPFARRDPRPWCLEAVAGRCDRLEPPEATARREAREEAGLELGRIERIAGYYPTPGIAAEYITAFVGEADLGAAGGVHGLAEEHEDIRAVVVPLAEALAAAEGGEVNNAPLLLSLYWLGLHHARLTDAWRRPLDGPEPSG